MKPAGAAKHFLLAFVLALAGYVLFYQIIEQRRTRNGPWRVTFTAGPDAVPIITIDQPKLGITNLQISFPGVTLPASAAAPAASPQPRSTPFIFSQPRPVPFELPFGKCVFMDSTFLPGTVTLQVFGHELELLPRVLVIDHQEHPWHPAASLALPRAPAPPLPAKR